MRLLSAIPSPVLTITTTGFVATVAQIIILRELLVLFYGNELSAGLIFAGWLSIDHGVKRRSPLSHWPSSIFLSLPVILISMFFSIYLLMDQMSLEATVIEKDLQTHTNPSPESPSLSELKEGQIVKIETKIGPWVRIKTQRGSLGWVPESSLLIFKGF